MLQRLLILCIALITLGCSSSEKAETTKQNLATTQNNTEMQHASKLLISGFMVNLKSELMAAVKEGGFGNAAGACQLKAPLVVESFSHENWSIKRVSDKPRNPLNKADSHEMEVLEIFADSLKKLEFFDEWNGADNKTDYNYYQPIYIGKLCLKCHGDIEKYDPEVVQALEEKYPSDMATNYKEGDLRGMFVVQIKTAEDIAMLEQSLQDSL